MYKDLFGMQQKTKYVACAKINQWMLCREMMAVYNECHTEHIVDLGGLEVSVLATGPKVRGFDPDRGFLRVIKIHHHFLRRGSKAVGPMS
jgi:proteasome assembly chaperone (PAC2) family protein